jgi:integrase
MDLVERNPVAQVGTLSQKSKRERVISREEYQNLVRELAPHAANLVKVLYWTGMRYSAAVGLTWHRVYMKKGLAYLEDEDVRNGKI